MTIVTVRVLLVFAALLVASSSALWPGLRRPEDDLYGVLGVKKQASEHDIKKAFRKRTKEHHPDLKDTAEEKEAAKEKMAQILRAYEVLSDADKRRDYDHFGKIGDSPNNVPGGMHAHHHQDPFTFFFNNFQQQQQQQHVEPIKSKSPSLSFRDLTSTILPYRGPRMAVLQFYHDHCNECRIFSPAWETFVTKHPLGLVLDVFRCNMMEADAQNIAQALGIAYGFGNAPAVAIIADGKVWTLSALSGVLFNNRVEFILPTLTAFVESFYIDAVADLPIDDGSASSVAAWLAGWSAASGGTTARILLSDNIEPALALAARLEGDEAEVRTASIEVMQDFAKRCRFPSNVVASKELIIVANRSFDGLQVQSAEWCGRLSLAATSSKFLPKRLLKFIEESGAEDTASASADLAENKDGILFLTARNVETICKQQCVIWLHPCNGKNENAAPPAAPDDIKEDLHPFLRVRVCAPDVPTKLLDLLNIKQASVATRSFLIIVNRGEVFVQPYVKTMHVAHVLADAMEGTIKPVRLPTNGGSFAALYSKYVLATTRDGNHGEQHASARASFPVRWWRWYFWLGVNYYYQLPFASFLPIVAIYFILKWTVRGGGPAQPAPQQQQPGNQGAARTETAPKNSANRQTGTNNMPSANESYVVSSADLKEAETGKGFLVLMFDRRCMSRGGSEHILVPPPELLGDAARFTARCVARKHAKLWNWLDQLVAASGHQPAEVEYVAIRKTKMRAAHKPPHQGLQSWLLDLKDGSAVPTISLDTIHAGFDSQQRSQ